MNEEFLRILMAVLGVSILVILPALVGVYLWTSGYVQAVIVEGIVWLFMIAILRDWLKGD